MESANSSYCRLCAESKAIVLDLRDNDGKRDELTAKLSRVNAVTDFTHETLPKTVCFVCVGKLDRAFEFVESIQRAQGVLSDIFLVQQIKEEDHGAISDSDNFSYDIDHEYSKAENISVAEETYEQPQSSQRVLISSPKNKDHVEGIQQAQGVLSDIFLVQQIKEEDHGAISDSDNFSYDKDHEHSKAENISVAEETDEQPQSSERVLMSSPKNKDHENSKAKNISVADEQPQSSQKVLMSGPKNNLKDSTSSGLDAIPLWQLNLSWKDYNWTCTFCKTQFPTIDELTDHSMQKHNTCNAYHCMDCNIRKLRLDSFLIHVKRHKKHLKLSCYKCDKSFSTPYKTNEHEKEHKKTEHVCWGCNSTFSTADELNNHTKIYYHTQKARPLLIGTDIDKITNNLTCLICKKTFSHKGSLNTHLLIHTERKRDHTCDKCGKCFLRMHDLEGHMITHENQRPYPCQICKAAFKTRKQLREHVGVHDNKKPFACDQCSRCFRSQAHLKQHSIIHTDSLPYVCSYCNKAFRFKNLLTQHIRQHTGVKPYSCSVCQREFTNWPNYNKHMKRRHGMDMAKKKYTPEGVYSKDPRTGEMIVPEETNNLVEWKNQLMMRRRRQPRRLIKTQALKSELDTNDTNSGAVNLSLTE